MIQIRPMTGEDIEPTANVVLAGGWADLLENLWAGVGMKKSGWNTPA